jgi:hypothetical protein
LKAIAVMAATSYVDGFFLPTGHKSVLKTKSRSDLGKNPFENVPDHVQMIKYEDKPSFSAKMTPQKREYVP